MVYDIRSESELDILNQFLFNHHPIKQGVKTIKGYGLHSANFERKSENNGSSNVSRTTFSKKRDILLEHKLLTKIVIKKGHSKETKLVSYSISPLGIVVYFHNYSVTTKRDLCEIMKICDCFLQEHIHDNIIMHSRIKIEKFEKFLDDNEVKNSFSHISKFFENIKLELWFYKIILKLAHKVDGGRLVNVMSFNISDSPIRFIQKSGLMQNSIIDDSKFFHYISSYIICGIHYFLLKLPDIKIGDYDEIQKYSLSFEKMIKNTNRNYIKNTKKYLNENID